MSRQDDDELVAQLVELGLTSAQGRVYAALLAVPGDRAPSIAARAGVSRTKIYEVLQALESSGFTTSSGDRKAVHRAIAPDVALPQWLESRERRRRLQRDEDERLAHTLVRALPRPVEDDEREDGEFETIVGERRTSAVFPQLGRRTAAALDVMQTPPFVQPRRQWNIVEAEALRRGVRVRVITSREGLGERARVAEAVRIGVELRVLERVPVKMILRDGEEAAIALRDPTPGHRRVTTWIVRQLDVVGALQTVFEREWERAAPVAADGSAGS